MKAKIFYSKRGFSLTEVTMALGIISFCALGVMGMLPIAVQSYRLTYDQTQAAHILNDFVTGFQAPVPAGGSLPNLAYTLPYPYTNGQVKWTNNSSAITVTNFYTTDAAFVTNSTNSLTRYKLVATVLPPNNGYGGRVYATIAWPANAAYVGSTNGTNAYWKGNQGNLDACVYFNTTIAP
ncbi:MAG: prepilin-type N-terminal cleavage/methylation domain-containing protein [Chthoniobacterales bacterium]